MNVDHKTVGAVREEQESVGEIPQLTHNIGADGKEYPRQTKRADPEITPILPPYYGKITVRLG